MIRIFLIDFNENALSTLIRQLQTLMPSQQDAILDDTSCFQWLRNRYLDLGAKYNYETIVIYLDIPIAEIQRRIEENNRTQARHRIKQDIIDEMVKTFELPQPDEIVINYTPDQQIEEWIAKHFAIQF